MDIKLDTAPSTIEEAVDMLVEALSSEDKEMIINDVNFDYHFSSGRKIRNNWRLWDKNSPIKLDAIKTYKIAHGDDLSGLIFEWAFNKVKNKTFDPIKYCNIFHEHWRRECDMTALEAGGITNIEKN